MSPALKPYLLKWQADAAIERDLAPYEHQLAAIHAAAPRFRAASDNELRRSGQALRRRARQGTPVDALVVETFALVREVADRVLGLRPYDVQVLAGLVLHAGKLAEMQTGEGKTLAAVLPACLHAWTGRGVHLLTFNDYLARRDAAWMGPVYQFLGLTVGAIQEGMAPAARKAAYAADVTYATAKEAGFDFLRMHLCTTPETIAHRPFHVALIDEADALLIDEARVPLVIAGARATSDTDPYDLAALIRTLATPADWQTDDHDRNVFLTEQGVDRVEAALGCGDLYADQNYLLLTEVNQALHAHALLHRDVDYLVRDEEIALVDAFTGRVMDDRRWPDGLQAALEAKEGLPIQPGGQILGSITLQHFLQRYPHRAGMTATAQRAARELDDVYGLRVVPLPPHRLCIRKDQPDQIFTHADARNDALLTEIAAVHATRRPMLVGTRSVAASEALAAQLQAAGIACQVLNAKHDAAEAAIIAEAGALGAVTISTNMAGRGTDIRLGGADEAQRDAVLALGGLYVIGTTRHESRRIDDQLRGRAGRQGDPGTSCFFVSLDDDLPVRYGIDTLIPPKLRPAPQAAPLAHPVIRREMDRLQRIVEGQNFEIRKTLWRYAWPVEQQRETLHTWRQAVLLGEMPLTLCATHAPARYAALVDRFGPEALHEAERRIMLHHIDAAWTEHLAFISHLREGIHLVGLGGLDPLHTFRKQIAEAFRGLHETIEARILDTFETAPITADGLDLAAAGVRSPSATWTYLVNDEVLSDLQQMLFGPSHTAFAAGAVLMTWPLLALWSAWRWLQRRRER